MKEKNTKSVRARKAAARKKAEAQKNMKIAGIIAIPVLMIALVLIVAVIGKKAINIELDYSAGLDANGLITGVKATDYVELCDLTSIPVSEPIVTMSDEDWEEHIAGILKESGLEELTDEYIAEKYGEYATTLAEYETYIKELAKSENIKSEVLDYLTKNSTVTSIPKNYYDLLEENWDAQYKAQYNYYNNIYFQILGYYNWNSYLDYYEVSKSEYKEMVKTAAEEAAKQNLILQAAYEQLGIQATDEDFELAIYEAGYEIDDMETAIADYGEPYWRQFAILYKVISELAEKVTIN